MKLYPFYSLTPRIVSASRSRSRTSNRASVRAGRAWLVELRSSAYCQINPQGAVPVLVDGGCVLTQSPPIIEFLDETRPLPLLPVMASEREPVRALAQPVASDIRPLVAARVLEYIAVDAVGCGSGEQIFNKEGAVRDRFCASFGKYQMS